MPEPATWNGDPACGHTVANAHQTHYCTYIRVPRLLSLQPAGPLEDLLPVTTLQWHELWFKVLLADLQAALLADGRTFEPVKLLRRGSEIFKLFARHAELVAPIAVRPAQDGVVHESGRWRPGPAAGGNDLGEVSPQLTALLAGAARGLDRLVPLPLPGLAAAVRDYEARLSAFAARFRQLLAETLPPSVDGAREYEEWLRLPELLSLQTAVREAWTAVGQSPEALWCPPKVGADENMFVVVHQCFELWFQVILRAVDRAVPSILKGEMAVATALLRGVVAIQRLLVEQIQIPATMLPLDFLRFREQEEERDGVLFRSSLSPASGTESYRFREIEIVSGLRDDPAFRAYLAGTEKLPIRLLTPRQRARMEEPTLFEAFRLALRARGVARLEDIFKPSHVPNPHADLADLAETLVDFDQFFRFWRFGHVSMVEKMIGGKSGTGFLGPEYLAETVGIKLQEKNRVFTERQVRPRFFEELWAVRTRLQASRKGE